MIFTCMSFRLGKLPKINPAATGSDVIVDAGRGHLLTNNHVIENGKEIMVKLSDGCELEANVVGADPATDIALLRIPAKGLRALPMGDSDRLLD